MKEILYLWGIKILIIIIGLVSIIGSFFIIKSEIEFAKNAILTTAIVNSVREIIDSDDNINYEISVYYEVDGHTYNEIIKKSSYMSEGSGLYVYYNSKNPEEMSMSKYTFSGLVLLLAGVIFFILGCMALFYNLIRKHILLKKGALISAEFKSVEINYNIKIGKKKAYYIICEGEDFITGKTRKFNSFNILENPKKIIKNNNITTFPVYIDRKNPKNYYVSLEALDLKEFY